MSDPNFKLVDDEDTFVDGPSDLYNPEEKSSGHDDEEPRAKGLKSSQDKGNADKVEAFRCDDSLYGSVDEYVTDDEYNGENISKIEQNWENFVRMYMGKDSLTESNLRAHNNFLLNQLTKSKNSFSTQHTSHSSTNCVIHPSLPDDPELLPEQGAVRV
jgi:hypothetical protein